MKVDFAVLADDDLHGLAQLFERLAMMERAPQLSRWGEQVWVMVNSEIACRLDTTPSTPGSVEFDRLGNEELYVVANLVTGVMDAGSAALVEFGESMCLNIAGEVNKRARRDRQN
jgi:hypothetical protein